MRIPRALLYAVATAILFLWATARAVEGQKQWTETTMPDYELTQEDSYLCTAVRVPKTPSRLVQIQPLAAQGVVHHMLLYACMGGEVSSGVWECSAHSPCPGGSTSSQIMYGWGLGAPALELPEDVGFAVGPDTSIQNIVLQVHYKSLRPPHDVSGVRLEFTQRPTTYSAGVISYARPFAVPAGDPAVLVRNSCCYRGFEPLHTWGFRVHTHKLGRLVYLDRMWSADVTERIVEASPQLPQGFYPTQGQLLWPGDEISATCKFDASKQARTVYAGPTEADEMCNLYLLSYSEVPHFMTCRASHSEAGDGGRVPSGMPLESHMVDSDVRDWTPPGPWNSSAPGDAKFGQVVGVAVGVNSTLWVLHRAGRVWEASSFDANHRCLHRDAIVEDTIYVLDKDSGQVLHSFGGDLLYMPHSVSLNREGGLWVTDAGRHQVLKLDPQEGSVVLEIGERMVPGSNEYHLCKPTQVAVGKQGDIFVADGYCNARVVRYTPEGLYVGQYVLPQGAMSVPHSLLLDECEDSLVVADRENKQIHEFSISTGDLKHSLNMSWGHPYALTPGPYGRVLALLWNREQDKGKVLMLAGEQYVADTVEAEWPLPGVGAPHDFALTAASSSLTGPGERHLAVVVGESRSIGSRLRKFVITPTSDFPSHIVIWSTRANHSAVAPYGTAPAGLPQANTQSITLTQATIAFADDNYILMDTPIDVPYLLPGNGTRSSGVHIRLGATLVLPDLDSPTHPVDEATVVDGVQVSIKSVQVSYGHDVDLVLEVGDDAEWEVDAVVSSGGGVAVVIPMALMALNFNG